jgi:hypothetical protein
VLVLVLVLDPVGVKARDRDEGKGGLGVLKTGSELLTWWKLRETKFPLTPTLSPGEREHRQPSWA